MVVRSDRRSLADLLAKVHVVIAEAEPAASEEEQAWRRRQVRQRSVAAVALAGLALGAGVGVPLIDDVDLGVADPYVRAHEFKAAEELATLQRRFESDPLDADAASRLTTALRKRGQRKQASEVEERHLAHVRDAQEVREQRWISQFAKTQGWRALRGLLTLYEEQGRSLEAKWAFEEYVGADAEDPSRRATYGVWLYQNDQTEEAIGMLETAIGSGHDNGSTYAYLGFAYSEAGRQREARRSFRSALKRDPSLGDHLRPRIAALTRALKR